MEVRFPCLTCKKDGSCETINIVWAADKASAVL